MHWVPNIYCCVEKMMKEHIVPKLCPTLESLIYPFDPEFTLEPISGFVWPKLQILHLPPMFEGEETNKYLLSIPKECPNLRELEIKIESFNATFPIDALMERSSITSLKLRINLTQAHDEIEHDTVI